MAYYSTEILEEGLKIAVHQDWFPKFDYTILGRVDFCICKGENNFLWAEAKKGTKQNIYESFVQLIFTIKKENTDRSHIPPKYLGAFDAEKIAFIEYGKMSDFFTMSDFDWTVTPSDHKTKEFKLLYDRIVNVLNSERLQFDFEADKDALKQFINNIGNSESYEIQVDENNFFFVFNRWCEAVKPKIRVKDWDKLKGLGVTEAEFFLADLLSENNKTLYENLQIILKETYYKLPDVEDAFGFSTERRVFFGEDGLQAHSQFWNLYHRPPEEDFRKYILTRRDLLVPFDVRERQGAFFTPSEWVELSQHYLAKELGRDWQDKYYVWDCCAGTGNLLFGLRNSERIFASTLVDNDVNIMKQNIKSGANLLESNVFKFDFLNDAFDKKDDSGEYVLPHKLREIIVNEPEKLVIYINPPYVEVSSIKGGKKGANASRIHDKYAEQLGTAGRELYTQMLMRIYYEIPGCIIGEFSKLKTLTGAAFESYRNYFQPQLSSMFLCPADTFDNVKGGFPIGFKIWNCTKKQPFKSITADIYESQGGHAFKVGEKKIEVVKKKNVINNWISKFRLKEGRAFLCGTNGNDFQHNNIVYILNVKCQMPNPRGIWIDLDNLIPSCIYLAVRQVFPATWLNDRDQFLHPKDSWEKDTTFHYDCLAYTLFHGQNRISSSQGINHFIPFKEIDVKAKTTYISRFMIDFLAGKVLPPETNQLFKQERHKNEPVVFSPEAQAVMDRGKELFRYYHSEDGSNANASFYDIRVRFQGTDQKGRMNPSSNNETYNGLLQNLRDAQKILAKKIEAKVYEHGFLEQ